MGHPVPESDLRKRMKKRRLIEIAVCAALFIFAVAFSVAYENSREVEIHDYVFTQYQSVTYNTDLLWGILIGWIGFVNTLILLLFDFLMARLETVEVGEYRLTYYRGLLRIRFYVDGELKAEASTGYYLEFDLPNGIKANVAVGKWSVHLSFSGVYPSIDL